MFLAASSLTVSGFVADLLVISAVAVACKHMRLPYTIALVAVGLGLGLTRTQLTAEFQLTPDLLFTILLPALLFEAAIHLHSRTIRQNLRPILLMAVPGMVITALAVGYAVHHLLGLSLQASLVFGALISATDPISVLALFKQLRAPKGLSVVIEGESLLNDGAAVVLFNILVAGSSISLTQGVGLFLFESVGGLAIGAALGWLVWRATEQIDDHLVEITLSTILAYGSYLIAQHFHTSGVMAVIAAGLLYGNFAMEKMSVHTRLSMGHFWDYLGFLCNSLVFLLIGTQVDLTGLIPALGPICVAFLVVCLARLLAVLLLSPFTRLPWRWQVMVFWSGLRGSIAMALAMALNLPERDQLLLLTFGVVLLSVFLQGLTVKTLMHKLGIVSGRGPLLDYESRLGELIANQRALTLLEKKLAQYHLSPEVYEEVAGPLKNSLERLKQELDASRDDQVRDEQRHDARHLMLAAQASGLREALIQGLISEEAYLSISQRLGCDQSETEEKEET
jgi:CPA1 family monovalent cation:H+ antiporter